MSKNNTPNTNKPKKKKKHLKIYDFKRYSPRKRERMKKRLRRNIIRWVIFTVISQIIVVYAFVWVINDPERATEDNIVTKQISVADTDIYIKRYPHYYLIFDTQEDYYSVYLRHFSWESRDLSFSEALPLLKAEDELTITVLKNKRIIVDVRSDSMVYYDIDGYNDGHSFDRMVCIVIFIIIWIVVTGISVLRVYFGIFQDYWLR